MSWDIYGNTLIPGCCEVHPFIHESYGNELLDSPDRDSGLKKMTRCFTNEAARKFGELAERVREAALTHPGDFTARVIAGEIDEDRGVVGTALRRLFEANEIVKVRDGRGTKPTIYRAKAR